MTRIRAIISAFLRREDGVVAVEFVAVFPLVMFMFFASIESGYMVLRSAMLERSLDLTVRDLRLGNLKNPTVEYLQQRLCSRTDQFKDCERSIVIELTKVNSGYNNLPSVAATCERRETAIRAGQESTTVDTGKENELMVVRACLVADAMFPTSMLGVTSAFSSETGTYSLVATSAFVNEPN